LAAKLFCQAHSRASPLLQDSAGLLDMKRCPRARTRFLW